VKLTGRQRQFLDTLLDLHKERQQPLHYSTVAESLGVRPMTAYDMLRLLEGHGLVASEYVVPKQGDRGRSNIVFAPTEMAIQEMEGPWNTALDLSEWKEFKAYILRALRDGQSTNYTELLDELATEITKVKSPMLYVTQMVTAVLLILYQLTEGARTGSISKHLQSLGLPGELWLHALAGLTLGLSLIERVNRRVASILLSGSKKYQEQLSHLNAENRARLSEFAQEAIEIMEA